MTILAPPWAVRKKYADGYPMMIVTETLAGTYAPTMNAFSFGVIAIEVRPVYFAAYSII